MQISSEVEQQEAVPNKKWPLERLAGVIEEEHDAIQLHGRKIAVHTWRLGRALSLAKKKCKSGGWSDFLKNVQVSIATDNRARRVFDFFEDEGELEGLTISEAYVEAGVSKPADVEPEIESKAPHEPSDESGEEDDVNSEIETETPIEVAESVKDDEGELNGDKTGQPSTPAATRKKAATSEPTAPPKEDPQTFGLRLAQLVSQARLLAIDSKNVTPSADETSHWLDLLEETRSHLDAIQDGLSHE